MRRNIAMGSVLLGIVVVGYLVSALWPAKVKIHCFRDQDGNLVVDLKPNWKVVGIASASFWLEGDDEYLWEIKKESEMPISRIVYGDIPPGATQQHPSHNVPPKALPNEGILYVGVDYRWDSTMPPAAMISSYSVKIELGDNGSTTVLGEAYWGEGLVQSGGSN